MASVNLKKSRYTDKTGMSPGQIKYVGDKSHNAQITLIKYDESNEEIIQIENFEHLQHNSDNNKNNWINISGISNENLMLEISNHFNFNSLMMEDIMNTEHLPKSAEFENHLFITLKMLNLVKDKEDHTIISEHLSLVLGKNYVISFQDNHKGDVFDSIRQRIKLNKSRIRKSTCDYLFYTLIDNIVDHFFLITEFTREKIEDLEDYILSNPSENMTEKIMELRKKISKMRRMIYMVHEAIKNILSQDSEFIDENINPYLKDVLDHTNNLNTSFDSFREYVSSLMDMYMSNLSNNLNVIMKTLTIFSLFFVPLTFLAGIYGMNFKNMPELERDWGYPIILLVMVSISILMYFYLKRKKWI